MNTKLPLISAAWMLGASACGHVQSPEAEPVTAEQTVVSTSGDQESSGGAVQQDPEAGAVQASAADSIAQQDAVSDEPPQVAAGAISKEAEGSGKMGSNTGSIAAEGREPRFLLTRGIENREPVDKVETFKPGETVYAFLEVPNPEGSEYAVNVRWATADGEPSEPIAVTIGASPHWRTWSWSRAPGQPGSYRCLIETEDGQILAEMPFRVESI